LEIIGPTIFDSGRFVYIILGHKLFPKEWENTYRDLPNWVVKVEVQTKIIFKTVEGDRKFGSSPGRADGD